MSVSISRIAAGRAGFTLLEVLVTIALIALLTGVLVVGTSRLLGDRPKTPDELFWLAAAAARKQALLQNQSVRLSLDAKSREFILASAASETRMPFVSTQLSEIEFLPPKSPSTYSAILIAGELVETRTQPFVTFYGDGTCSPFRVQLKSRTQTRVLEIDPWTCAPMLAPLADR
jgi:prepilin-type N-terminal cleavage/methylation domain-containing protein